MTCRASGTFRRRSCRDATTWFAPQPPRGICIGYGPRLISAWFRTRGIPPSRPATFTNLSRRRTVIAAADSMHHLRRAAHAAAVGLLWLSAAQAAGNKLLRFPDVWRDRVVF